MRSYPLHAARAEFSKLVERALAGEPQRVTRYGMQAVVIVSEEEWRKRPKGPGTLADLMIEFAGETGFDDVLGGEKPWKSDRLLGEDFSE